MADSFVWNRVFVLDADMHKDAAGEYVFSEEDAHGYLGGELRVKAAQALVWKGLVRHLFVVAGPTKDGASKAHIMAKMIGECATPLESSHSNTSSNFETITAHYEEIGGPEDGDHDAVLTHLYHLPRALYMAKVAELDLYPLPAEGVLAVFGHPDAGTDLLRLLTTHCGNESYARRILSEARGCVELQVRRWRT